MPAMKPLMPPELLPEEVPSGARLPVSEDPLVSRCSLHRPRFVGTCAPQMVQVDSSFFLARSFLFFLTALLFTILFHRTCR